MNVNEVLVKTAEGTVVRQLEELAEGADFNGKTPSIKKGTQVVYKNGPLGVYYVGKVYVDKYDPEDPFYYEMIMLSGGHAPTTKEKALQPV